MAIAHFPEMSHPSGTGKRHPAGVESRPEVLAERYALVREVGRGAAGVVWEARDLTLKRRVAVKILWCVSPETMRRFDLEVHAAASVRSEHSVAILDRGVTDDGRPFIVMELLEGESLDARLARCGQLSLWETTALVEQVCEALSLAHEQDIVHRDLKPENVLLTRRPGNIAKVLDFGIAKVASNDWAGMTQTGMLLGTPTYMSPEQTGGASRVDWRTDLWSLGVIVYQCLTGRVPFEADSFSELLTQICTAPFTAPSTIADLPPAIDAWMTRALQKEPDRRFQTADALSRALREIAAEVEVPTPDDVESDATIVSESPVPSQSPAPSHSPLPRTSSASVSWAVATAIAAASTLAGVLVGLASMMPFWP